MLRILSSAALLAFTISGLAADTAFTYEAIAKRHSKVQLDATRVAEAKMHGECLVGLKQLNFQKRDDFDPVAEWTSFRSLSLLEQFPPCNVLIIMEVARRELLELEAAQ